MNQPILSQIPSSEGQRCPSAVLATTTPITGIWIHMLFPSLWEVGAFGNASSNAGPPGPRGGITISSAVLNTADSSTTTGFDDFGEGTTWQTEADFQYWLGNLPGGMNVGGLYSFNQDCALLNTKTRLVLQPGQGVSLVVPRKGSTWAAYWSGWQYLYTAPPGTRPLEQISGGRGLIPSRDNDCFGVGYYYNSIQTLGLSGLLGIQDSAQGFECFYNIAITPATI